MALLPADKNPRRRSARLDLPQGRPLRLVVVADTHGRPHPRAADLIARERPDAILHAGDVGELEVLDALAPLAPELIAVRGNIDAVTAELPDVIHLEVFDRDALFVTVMLLHIAVYGPRLRADARRLAERHRARLVVCGHSHVPLILQDRGVAVFNPGSIGPRRFALPVVFGVCQIDRHAGIRCHHVDCDTGQRWRPPGA